MREKSRVIPPAIKTYENVNKVPEEDMLSQEYGSQEEELHSEPN